MRLLATTTRRLLHTHHAHHAHHPHLHPHSHPQEPCNNFQIFRDRVANLIPADRLIEDPLRLFAHGTDASAYRLTPKLVVKIEDESEIRYILPLSSQYKVPVTFRAAGTSLSGQAVTDSVLVKLGSSWDKYEIHDNGNAITLQPGLIGGQVNRALAPFQRKIGPDPSSIDSCMIGGIINNNSSGMCCGVMQNSYHTIKDLRVVFKDGSVLDTSDEEIVHRWSRDHPHIVHGIEQIRDEIRSDQDLVAKIKRKFAIKCTTGYSINAFVDFDHPIDIIKHLIVGSEGTLCFLSKVTLNTVVHAEHNASAMILFDDVTDACEATVALRNSKLVDAVEIMDASCLLAGIGKKHFESFDQKTDRSAALLVECRGVAKDELYERIDGCTRAIQQSGAQYYKPSLNFSSLEEECTAWWNFRKGLLPLVGSLRRDGTTVLIEDVACPISNLAQMTKDLRALMTRFHYPERESCVLGHALEGNLHLSLSQSFRDPRSIERYNRLMVEMMDLVIHTHNGSCKAEHGTGRNVAPWVEIEWGPEAYQYMWRIKNLFDQENTINPNVLLSHDKEIHIKNLKRTPVADPIINKCTECGFCESNCPSLHLTLSPRQRIAVSREMARLEQTGENPELLDEMKHLWEYAGENTCAADGMCSVKCPFGINTGSLIKKLREQRYQSETLPANMAQFVHNHFALITETSRQLLNVVHVTQNVVGSSVVGFLSAILHGLLPALPRWHNAFPRGASLDKRHYSTNSSVSNPNNEQIVYFASCPTRTFGASHNDNTAANVPQNLNSLLKKANIDAVFPSDVEDLCCGLIFESRGLTEHADAMLAKLEHALEVASDGGRLPIVVDASPCVLRLKDHMKNAKLKESLLDTTLFIRKMILPKVVIKQKEDSILLHVPCSSKRMGLTAPMQAIASTCCKKVTLSDVPCCGTAGDRGMRFPELPASSLRKLESRAIESNSSLGVSTSRTCEIALSLHANIPFHSLVQIVDECSEAKTQN